ncbi:hypothetical protein MIMGU_mgv1a018282mg, partial [Erythranthe guttata]
MFFFGLEDIYFITGLPVIGEPIVANEENPQATRRYLLKMEDQNVSTSVNVKVGDILGAYPSHNDDMNEEELDRYCRAYLMYIIGTIIFPNTPNNT